MLSQETRQLCQLLAKVIDYPDSSLLESVTECAKRLENYFPGVGEPMQSFAGFIQSQSLGTLEELYTHTFDVAPATTLYVGYHLFGETARRSAFLVKLEEAYQVHHFSNGTELADHLCVLLRFFTIAQDADFVIPLLQECLLPVSAKVEEALQKSKNRYGPVISSLRLFLKQVLAEANKNRRLPA